MIYRKIAFLRKYKKVTIEEFAAAIGMSKNGVEKMMRTGSCSVARLEKISKFFDVPINYFFDNQEPKPYTENSVINVVPDGPGSMADKDLIIKAKQEVIESKEKIIQLMEENIKLLYDKLGFEPNTNTNGDTKQLKSKIKGFGAIHDTEIKMILHKIMNHIKPQDR